MVRKSFGAFIAQTKQLKQYIYFVALTFIVGIWFGYSTDVLENIVQQAMHRLEEMGQQVGNAENPQFTAFYMIFLNNVQSVLLIIYTGIFFAVVPFFSILINGLTIGYVLSAMNGQGESMFELIVLGILPHGILEIPALIISGAFGIFLGLTAIRRILGMMFNRETASVRAVLLRSLPFAGWLIFFLLIAAFIEGFITIALLSH